MPGSHSEDQKVPQKKKPNTNQRKLMDVNPMYGVQTSECKQSCRPRIVLQDDIRPLCSETTFLTLYARLM